MRRVLPGLLAIFFILFGEPACSAAGDSDLLPPGITKEVLVGPRMDVADAILSCLSENLEAVLRPDRVYCAGYRQGAKYLGTHTAVPFDTDFAKVCPDTDVSKTTRDARLLTADTIRRVATHPSRAVGPHGIRLFGALFCEAIDLVGLDLPYSLIIDKAAFRNGIEIRNLRTKGDLSLDGSYVFKYLKVFRSKIEGSFFADESFIENLSITDTVIEGSASLRESVLFGFTQFDRSTIERELSIRASALSYFITQFSRIGGLLDLSYSQARCAYHVNKSEIGFVVAKQTGFGVLGHLAGSTAALNQYGWHKLASKKTAEILKSHEIAKATSRNETCITEYDRPNRAEFFIFDSKVTSSLCINEFQWLGAGESAIVKSLFVDAPKPVHDHLITKIALNGNTIGNNLILDLWNKADPRHDDIPADLHRLEIIGVKTDALIVDFGDSKRKYRTSIDGLDFGRVYDSEAACEFGGSEEVAIGDRKLTIITDFRVQLKLPKEDRVLQWLGLNDIRSSQPYTAFAAAFESVGADSTRLKVARAGLEMCARATRWGPDRIVGNWCETPAVNSDPRPGRTVVAAALPGAPPAGEWGLIGDALVTIVESLSDFVVFMFQTALYFVADHGHRPGKVIWWVGVTLVLYWSLFLLWFRVVAFAAGAETESEKARPLKDSDQNEAPQLRPLGFLFLFDRLLPGYHISGENYRITRYYKRVPAGAAIPDDAQKFKRLLTPWYVAPVKDPSEIKLIERFLTALRLIGLVFAIFLAAAVSHLIAK